MKQICEFPFFEKYFSDEAEAVEHALECTECATKAIRFEGLLSGMKTHRLLSKESGASEKDLRKAAEWIAFGVKDDESRWKQVMSFLNDAEDLSHLMQMVSFLLPADDSTVRTPEYLKKIVANTLEHDEKTKRDSSIIISLKNGLRLLNATAESLFLLPGTEEAVPVRSGSAAASSGMLQFYSEESEQKNRVLYQVVRDSASTVMLTLKLDGFETRPRMLILRKNERLIQSQPLQDDFVYFSHLEPGEYHVEVKDAQNNILRKVSLSLVDE